MQSVSLRKFLLLYTGVIPLLFFSFLVRQDWTPFSKTSEDICNSLLNVVPAEGIVYRQMLFAVELVEAGQDQ